MAGVAGRSAMGRGWMSLLLLPLAGVSLAPAGCTTCAEGEVYRDGECLVSCESDADCAASESCLDFACAYDATRLHGDGGHATTSSSRESSSGVGPSSGTGPSSSSGDRVSSSAAVPSSSAGGGSSSGGGSASGPTWRWTAVHGGAGEEHVRGVDMDGAGNVYVVGDTNKPLDGQPLPESDGWDALVMKFDPQGGWAWTRLVGQAGDQGATAAAVTPDGMVYVVGTTAADLYGQEVGGPYNPFVTLYDANGNLRWTRVRPAAGNVFAMGVAVTPDGDIAVVGTTDVGFDGQPFQGGTDVFLVEWDPEGNHRSTRTWGGSNVETGVAIAVGADGSVVVTGSSEGNGSFADYYTAKYATANGALLWEQRYNGPANRYDYADAVAVDANGTSVHTTGPAEWRARIGKIPVTAG